MNRFKLLVCKLTNVSQDPIAIDWKEACLLLKEAADAIDALSAPGRDDFSNYMSAQAATAKARIEYNRASSQIDYLQMRERCAELLSQHQPLAGLEIDREKVRKVLSFVQCGRLE